MCCPLGRTSFYQIQEGVWVPPRASEGKREKDGEHRPDSPLMNLQRNVYNWCVCQLGAWRLGINGNASPQNPQKGMSPGLREEHPLLWWENKQRHDEEDRSQAKCYPDYSIQREATSIIRAQVLLQQQVLGGGFYLLVFVRPPAVCPPHWPPSLFLALPTHPPALEHLHLLFPLLGKRNKNQIRFKGRMDFKIKEKY